MKTFIICSILFSVILLFSLPALADSPLTSTQFYKAYMDIPQVKNAEGKKLDEGIFTFLTDQNEHLDARVAAINAMGWSKEGTNNGQVFIGLMARKLKKLPKDLKIKDLSSEELLCLGYILSLDNYFKPGPARDMGGQLETTDALTLVEDSASMQPRNFTVHLIASLVKAQTFLDNTSEWGKIYLTVNKVISSDMKRNMREEAVGIINDYIDGYKQYAVKDEIWSSAVVIKPVKEVRAEVGLHNLALSPDGNRLITSSGDESAVRIWNIKTDKELTSLDTGSFTDDRMFSPDGRWIIISDFTPQVTIYSSKDYSQVKKLSVHDRVLHMAVHPSNLNIAFAFFDGTVEIYSPVTWEKIQSFKAHDKYVSTVEFSSDGRYLLTGSYDHTVKLWDVRHKYSPVNEYKDFRDGTFAYFMPGDKEILVRDFAGYIKILDLSSGKLLWEKQLTETLHDVSSDPSGNFIAGASETGTIYFWNWKKNMGPLIFRAHNDQVTGVKFSSDGKELYSCGLDKKWKIWTVRILENILKDVSTRK